MSMRTKISIAAAGLVAWLCGCVSQQYAPNTSSLAAPVTTPVHISPVQIKCVCHFSSEYLTPQILEGLASSHIFMNLGTTESVSSYSIIPTVFTWARGSLYIRLVVQEIGTHIQIYTKDLEITDWSYAACIANLKKSMAAIGIEIAQAIANFEEIEPVQVVVVKKSPIGRFAEAGNMNDTASGQGQSSRAAVTATSEKLAVLKALREGGDISDREYRQRRMAILDTISPLPPRSVKSQRPSNSEYVRIPSEDRERVVVANAIAAPEARFDISAHVEDDPADGEAIMGNGDGLIQRGEAFNLVVVVANTSTSTANNVICTVILPEDQSLKSYSEIHQDWAELAPSAAATNRINLAMPMNVKLTAAPVCRIEVKDEGPSAVEHLSYELPTDLE